MAVCINDSVNFMERQDLELFDENMESVFVEINKSHIQSLKDIIVGGDISPTQQRHWHSQ